MWHITIVRPLPLGVDVGNSCRQNIYECMYSYIVAHNVRYLNAKDARKG